MIKGLWLYSDTESANQIKRNNGNRQSEDPKQQDAWDEDEQDVGWMPHTCGNNKGKIEFLLLSIDSISLFRNLFLLCIYSSWEGQFVSERIVHKLPTVSGSSNYFWDKWDVLWDQN